MKSLHLPLGVAFIVLAFTLTLSGSSTPLMVIFDPWVLAWLALFTCGGLFVSYQPQQVGKSLMVALKGEPETSPEALRSHLAVLTRLHQLLWAGGTCGCVLAAITMLADLSDPAGIGTSVAFCLLTLLYGGVLAEIFARGLHSRLVNNCDSSIIAKSQAEQTGPTNSSAFQAGITVLVLLSITTLFIALWGGI